MNEQQQNFVVNPGGSGPPRKDTPQQHARVLTHINPRDIKTIQTIRPVLPTPILTNIVTSAGLPPSGHVSTPKIPVLSNVLDPSSHVQPMTMAQSFTKAPGVIQIASTTATVSMAMPLAVHSIRASNTVFTSNLSRDGCIATKPSPVLTTTMIRPVGQHQTTVQVGIPASHLPSVIHQTMQPRGAAMITAVKPAGQTVITRPGSPAIRFGATTVVPAGKPHQMVDLTRASLHAATPTTNTIQITLQHQRDLTPKQPHLTPAPFNNPVPHKASAKVIVSNSGMAGITHGIASIPNKPVLSVSATNIATLRPAIGHASTMSHATASIPIAKVTPHRQQVPGGMRPHPDTTRRDTTVTHAVPASGILMPQVQQRSVGRPLITSVALTAASSHTTMEQNTDRMPLSTYQQQAADYLVPYPQLSQLVYHQLGGTPIVSQPTAYKAVVSQQQKPQTVSLTQDAMTTAARYPAVVVSLDHTRPVQSHLYHSSDTMAMGVDSYGMAQSTNITHMTTTPNPSSSPRPTILRKRTNDGMVKKQVNLTSTMEAMYPQHGSASLSNTSSPKTPAAMESRDSSQSSTDTALSNDASPPNSTMADIRIKQEPPDSVDSGSMHQAVSSTTNIIEVSPRKKPRKQLLQANEELKDHLSSDEDVKPSANLLPTQLLETPLKQEIREDYTDSDGIRWTVEKKRPNISLLNQYVCNWKTRNNHFTRHSDIKVKDERRPTVNELSNQRRVNQKTNGWKFYYMSAQLEELLEDEDHTTQRLGEIQNSLSPKNRPTVTTGSDTDDDVAFLHEVCQGVLQRSQLVQDQVLEAKTSLLRVLQHRTRIMEIIHKHISKRPIKKKERP